MMPAKDDPRWSHLVKSTEAIPEVLLATRMFLQRVRRQYRNNPNAEQLKACEGDLRAYFEQNERIVARDMVTLFPSVTQGNQEFISIESAIAQIASGQPALFAGSHRALMKLPRGNWIGGTIPYFMTATGGIMNEDRVFVTTLGQNAVNFEIKVYDSAHLSSIPKDYKSNGLSFIVMPGMSKVAEKFSREAVTYDGLFDSPLVGWLSGTLVDRIGQEQPLVFNGRTGESHFNDAVVMHLSLPANRNARVSTFNAFQVGTGPEITFEEEGFEVFECHVDGKKMFLADYMKSIQGDNRFPLMGDYAGMQVNVAFQKIDENTKRVNLLAPVLKGVSYRLAEPILDYQGAFKAHAQSLSGMPIFSCNCILNYLYANLQGQTTGSLVGPVTFGEIAYIMLNQTLVYVTLE